MPSTNSAKSATRTLRDKLLGGDLKFSEDELLAILEDRREILVRFMKMFSSEKLGQLSCLTSSGSGGMCHSLDQDCPTVSGEMFSLQTRGIFAGAPNARYTADNYCKTFGIDYQGNWLLVRIKYSTSASEPTHQKAGIVYVSVEDLHTLILEIGIDPLVIWTFFGYKIERWVSDRKCLYEQALAIQGGWKEEAQAFSLLKSLS